MTRYFLALKMLFQALLQEVILTLNWVHICFFKKSLTFGEHWCHSADHWVTAVCVSVRVRCYCHTKSYIREDCADLRGSLLSDLQIPAKDNMGSSPFLCSRLSHVYENNMDNEGLCNGTVSEYKLSHGVFLVCSVCVFIPNHIDWLERSWHFFS